MGNARHVPSSVLVEILRSAGEPTRLRLLLLLIGQGEFNVKDLTQILGQSQPRLSRHLKLLTDAGLIERFQEGSSVFYRCAERGQAGACSPGSWRRSIRTTPMSPAILPAPMRCGRSKDMAAQAYFQGACGGMGRDPRASRAGGGGRGGDASALGAGPFGLLVDLGTGTGKSWNFSRRSPIAPSASM